jgi:hypothetical protein
VQVRGLLKRSELDRYNALMEVGGYLESQGQYEYAHTVQKEVDILILPAIERLKEKSRARDRASEEYLRQRAEAEHAEAGDDEDDETGEDGEPKV